MNGTKPLKLTKKTYAIKTRLGWNIRIFVFFCLISIPLASYAQTKLKLSAIQPGTEQVQLISNGDFQIQGPPVAGNYPFPTGWSRFGDMFANSGLNTVPANQGVVAEGLVNGSTPIGMYSHNVTLKSATAYVLSAYMWNFGSAANRVNTVIDLNDAPGEPQLFLNYMDSEAEKGYFVYHYFNTAVTGTNIMVRVFFDGKTGTGADSGYHPIGAQWDNIAITELKNFEVPKAINATTPISPTPPQLSIQPTGSDVVISWPTNHSGIVLLATSNMVNATTWQKLNNYNIVANESNTVKVPNMNPEKYFRGLVEVDTSTLSNKLMMGYQGWFACAGDGSPANSWIHWFRNNTPTCGNLTVEMWPDMTEFDADELYSTSITNLNGSSAKLYSAYNKKTVMRHFKWMKDYNLDGVFFQRFLTDTSGAVGNLRNKVSQNVRAGAEAYGRTFAIMYDISGYPTDTLISKLTSDWNYLVNNQGITKSPAYLHHNGKPVVAIWGFGFSGRSDTPAQCLEAILLFKAAGCTVMGGVPSYWRTLTNDAQTDPAWAAAFRSFDIISPWSVGRYSNNADADVYRTNVTVPDLADCNANGIDYLPVVWPGFSWKNLHGGASNIIPRNGGDFYWRQVYNGINAGCKMLYGAMFDEVDEATAMFKVAPTPADQPPNCNFLPLNVDGYNLPSDWYLRLADEAGKMLRGEILLQSTMPISP